jgi:hypothetical protein
MAHAYLSSIVNLKTAFPPTLIVSADEVIE